MAAKYKALTYVMIDEDKKAPGDPITQAEIDDAGQSENVQELITTGAIGSPDDEINEAHAEVSVDAPAGSDHHVIATEEGRSNDSSN